MGPDGVDGCADDRGVFSKFTIHQHELVHAVRWPSRLYLPLEEGLAEAFGDDWNRFEVQGNIRDLLEDPFELSISRSDYPLRVIACGSTRLVSIA
jgi:hypothetical protein